MSKPDKGLYMRGCHKETARYHRETAIHVQNRQKKLHQGSQLDCEKLKTPAERKTHHHLRYGVRHLLCEPRTHGPPNRHIALNRSTGNDQTRQERPNPKDPRGRIHVPLPRRPHKTTLKTCVTERPPPGVTVRRY